MYVAYETLRRGCVVFYTMMLIFTVGCIKKPSGNNDDNSLVSIATDGLPDFSTLNIKVVGTEDRNLDVNINKTYTKQETAGSVQLSLKAGEYRFSLEIFSESNQMIASSEICSEEQKKSAVAVVEPGKQNVVSIIICKNKNLSSGSPAGSGQNTPKEEKPQEKPQENADDIGKNLEAGKVITLKMKSRYMNGGNDWDYNIYLPESYKTGNKRYPVIYSLHGGGGDNNGNSFEIGYIKKVITEVIVVFPNGGKDNFYLDSGVVRQQGQNPDSHITKELIPYIDSNFRTINDRKARAVTGFSMGGYGAYHFAFKYPELFSGAAPMAAGGPYGPNGQINNYDSKEDPHKLAVSNADKIKGRMNIIMSVGKQDLFDYNREFSQILTAQGIDHIFNPIDGLKHDHGGILNNSAVKIYQTITKDFPK
ncbi:MAG: hypothetical protein HQK54_03865 [Oligoflexales bacterium]|nr:hypothetical protein [Oligoflexales bacterium]